MTTGFRLYRYVGPPELLSRLGVQAAGRPIAGAEDVMSWIADSDQETDAEGLYRATFVVDARGQLRIDDYGCEHVVCAAGGPVRSAGVMWFEAARTVRVERVTNQSTGFCPEPSSWTAVAAALDAAGIQHLGAFTQEIVFRRCPSCGQRNIVKDEWFHCAVCDAELPLEWNFDGPMAD